MVPQPGVLNPEGYSDRAWLGMIALSIFCHFLFFSGVVFLPDLAFTRPQIPTSVEVDLVSLPAAQPRKKAPSRQPPSSQPVETAKPERPKTVERKEKPAEMQVPSTKKAVSLTPSKPVQVKRSVKKKTYNASRAIDKAISKIEKQASESRPSPVLKAIDALRKKDRMETDAGGANGAVAGIGRGTKKALELLDIYHAEIWDRITRNWAYSEELDRGHPNPEAIVNVKIMRDGEIRDIWFETRSGSRRFDDSCLKAVKKSNPLPPLPDGFLKPFHEVGFRFNLSELRRRP
jgi:colicin import membrane protein